MGKPSFRVVVVDDDASILKAYSKLIGLMGHSVTAFASPKNALRYLRDEGADCLVVDLNMPGLSGLDLQSAIAGFNPPVPMVFVSGAANVQSSVTAMRGGACHFLEKPVEFEDLRAAIAEATEQAVAAASAARETEEAQKQFDELTPRQQSVFRELVTGAPNKVIAFRLGIGERTVKAHRQALMERLGANSVSDVISIARKIGLTSDPSSETPEFFG